MPSRRSLLAALSLATLPASRLALAEPAAERVLLSVSGRISGGGVQDFTLSSLESLGMEELRTSTPWTTGPQRFTGVRLESLLAKVGSLGETLRMTALNEYAITMPASDARQHGPILASRLNGQAMRVRDKGPIWLIYPFSSHPQLDNTTYYERSIWQLRKIEVL